MNKYIVKNCPAMDDMGRCFQGSVLLNTAFKECELHSDCIIKQTIDVLLREKNNPFELPIVDEDERIHKCGKNELAREILQKWEIEDAG